MKIVGVIVLVLVGGSCLAQVDSLSSPVDSVVSSPVVPSHPSPQLNESSVLKDEYTVKVQKEEVPVAIQTALQGEEFKGWENGVISRNEQGTRFRVELMNGMKHESIYFESNGNRLKVD